MRTKLWALSMVIAAGTAQAGFTTVNGPASGEQSQLQIITGEYGGTWSASGLNFVGTGVNAGKSFVRIADFIGVDSAIGSAKGQDLNVHVSGFNAGATDQIWHDGTSSVAAVAKYAGNSQEFGYRDTTNHWLFSVPSGGSGGGLTQTGTIGPVAPPGAFTLLDRSPAGTGTIFSSDQAANAANSSGRTDHMITYRLMGFGGNQIRYLVFFEDQTSGDYDFNDLAVEMVTTIPLPPAAWAGLSTLAAAAGVGFIRRRKMTVA